MFLPVLPSQTLAAHHPRMTENHPMPARLDAMIQTTPEVVATPQAPGVVNCVAYSFTGQRVGDITIEEISEVLTEPDKFVWVGLLEPDEPLLEKLQEEFGLHDLAIEDAHAAHQRPKVEAYGNSLFVVAQTAHVVDGRVEFGESHIFLGRNFIVVVRHGASLSYAPVRRACEQDPEMLAMGPSYCLYAVLDFIVDNYLPIVTSFREQLHALEDDIFGGTYNLSTIRSLYNLKKDLVTLQLVVAPLQDVLSQLMRLYPGTIHKQTRPYFRDVFDHSARIGQSTEAMREMLTAAISVNLAVVSVSQNDVVKRLAGWAALLAVPTLLASWYGMNFRHMPELDKPWAYPMLFVVMAMLCGGLYWRLKRSKWL